MQVDELRAVAAQRGWTVVDVFIDTTSGATDRRPELDRLNAEVERGRIDVVAVWKFDRFARSTRHLLTALDGFRTRNVDFVSLRDSVDTSTPQGRFLLTLLGAFAELEREVIRERTRAGVEAAIRRGAKVGRPKASIDLDAARVLLDAGGSIRSVSKALRTSASTLGRALRDAAKEALSDASKLSAGSGPESGSNHCAETAIRTRGESNGFSFAPVPGFSSGMPSTSALKRERS